MAPPPAIGPPLSRSESRNSVARRRPSGLDSGRPTDDPGANLRDEAPLPVRYPSDSRRTLGSEPVLGQRRLPVTGGGGDHSRGLIETIDVSHAQTAPRQSDFDLPRGNPMGGAGSIRTEEPTPGLEPGNHPGSTCSFLVVHPILTGHAGSWRYSVLAALVRLLRTPPARIRARSIINHVLRFRPTIGRRRSGGRTNRVPVGDFEAPQSDPRGWRPTESGTPLPDASPRRSTLGCIRSVDAVCCHP